MWEKKEGVFQQPLDAACFNLADNIKTVLELRKQNVQLNVSFIIFVRPYFGILFIYFTLNGSLEMICVFLAIGGFSYVLSSNCCQGLRMS